MVERSEAFQQALDNCSRDPIHIPGVIQNFGFLVAGNATFEKITHVSANAARLLAVDPAQSLGQDIAQQVGEEFTHDVRNVLGHETIDTQRILLPNKTFDGTEYQVSVHRRGTQSLVEFIPETTPANSRLMPLHRVQAFLSGTFKIEDATSFWDDATAMIRALIGYDRVKFYRFLPNGAGEVISETRNPKMPSFLGLRFPAHDIPPNAKLLYAKTPIRVLSDIHSADVDLLALDGAAPLDMSLALLRGKDKVHLQYLKNMEVGATLTIPVVIDGALWGLFAAHNMSAKPPDPSALAAAELAGKLISLRLQHTIESDRQSRYAQSGSVISRLCVADDSELALEQAWTLTAQDIRALLPCDGLALFYGAHMLSVGAVPERSACAALLAPLDPAQPDVRHYDDLCGQFPDQSWGPCAGALVIAAPSVQNLRLVFFRKPAELSIAWAGAPAKTLREDETGPRLDPRNSFSTYMEQISDRADEWTADDIETGHALAQAVQTAVTVQDQMRANRHRMGLMVQELNHRVRNILSLVQSLSRQSQDDARSVSGYAKALEDRIQALAGAHNLLTRANASGVSLAELVTLELQPYSGKPGRWEISGPPLLVSADAASVLALVFHELTSNAVKYGALQGPDGSVSIRWALSGDGVEITWQERGGPPVTPPERTGFGRSIIEEAIPFEFMGKAALRYEPAGVEATFWLPGETISSDTDAGVVLPSETTARDASAAHKSDLIGKSALIVEDNYVVALSTQKILTECGFEHVTAVASLEEAFAALDDAQFDFALLDVNLQGALSTPLAQHLRSAGVPFIFATGYGSASDRIVEAFDAPVVAKPMQAERLKTLVHQMFEDR